MSDVGKAIDLANRLGDVAEQTAGRIHNAAEKRERVAWLKQYNAAIAAGDAAEINRLLAVRRAAADARLPGDRKPD